MIAVPFESITNASAHFEKCCLGIKRRAPVVPLWRTLSPLALDTAVQAQSQSVPGTEGSFLCSLFRAPGRTVQRRIRAQGEVFTWLGVWNAQPGAVRSGLPPPLCCGLWRACSAGTTAATSSSSEPEIGSPDRGSSSPSTRGLHSGAASLLGHRACSAEGQDLVDAGLYLPLPRGLTWDTSGGLLSWCLLKKPNYLGAVITSPLHSEGVTLTSCKEMDLFLVQGKYAAFSSGLPHPH